jgi:hypothetical protein
MLSRAGWQGISKPVRRCAIPLWGLSVAFLFYYAELPGGIFDVLSKSWYAWNLYRLAVLPLDKACRDTWSIFCLNRTIYLAWLFCRLRN